MKCCGQTLKHTATQHHLNKKLINKNPTEPLNIFTTRTILIFNLCTLMKLLLLCEKKLFFCHLVLGSLVASCCLSIGKKTQQDQGQAEEPPHLVSNLDYRLHSVVKTGDEISESFFKKANFKFHSFSLMYFTNTWKTAWNFLGWF